MVKSPIPPEGQPPIKGVPPIAPEPTGPMPDKGAFQSYLKEAPTAKEAMVPQGPTPMDLEKGASVGTMPSLDSLLNQVSTAEGYFQNLQNNLNTPNLKFKVSQEKLLNNKLTEATSQISSLAERVDANQIAVPDIPKGATPVTKFLSYVTYGQDQIGEVKKQLSALSKNKGEMKPADMLLMQVNIAQAQQALEYSSVLLSKIVDSIKQLMNIQI